MQNTPLENHLFFSQLPKIGAGTYWRVLETFGSLEIFLAGSTEQKQRFLGEQALSIVQQCRADSVSRASLLGKVENDLSWLAEHGAGVVLHTDAAYPDALKHIQRPPPLLYVLGNPEVLSLPQVAMVGSRKPSSGGQTHAREFARELAVNGFVVTSGLALGVDTWAHKGALDAGGKTIAVMGTGIDQIYPQRNLALAREIIDGGGAVISEFPLGIKPLAANFPQRNRIISGLSSGVLVVEAAIRSGSLITAKYALEQNREVFAIPGSIQNPLSRGCHALIKQGAKLVETAQDVADELKGYLTMKWNELEQASQSELSQASFEGFSLQLEPLEKRLLKSVGYDGKSFEVLAAELELQTGELMGALLNLELKGLVENLGYGYVLTSSAAALLSP